MSYERRFDHPGPRPERSGGARYQSGSERDRYRTGREQRYSPTRDWREAGREGGYEGNRRYSQGGYREETGFSDFDDVREFDDPEWSKRDDDAQYFGTGSHYGGGFGTAPGSRASSSGAFGAPGYAGRGAWSDPSDWTPEEEERADALSHRGRGPKGYTRSDERLLETICERLTDDPRIDAGDIEVEVKQQAVTLRGTVDRRHTKYAVEELIENCGVRDIDNQLRVRSSW